VPPEGALESRTVDESERRVRVEVAHLAGAIERAAGDLALAEEPSNLAVVLEAGAPDD
jgi:hypothetical protein